MLNMNISKDDLINALKKLDWSAIREARLEHKKEVLKYTKHSKKRTALLSEIKWLESTKS